MAMTKPLKEDKAYDTEFPRRVRLSAIEIGVAVALTFAALIQLISALSQQESRSTSADGSGYIRPGN